MTPATTTSIPNLDQLRQLVSEASTILILQPDSPDGDSFGTALGLEEILGDLGKTVVMFAYKETENYLRQHEGWDRVSQTFPKQFDATILVDTGSPNLIKETLKHNSLALTSKPFIIIDHHVSRQDFGFNTIEIVTESCSTAELVTRICLEFDWPINSQAAAKLTTALLSDSLGLTIPEVTATSVEMLAHLVRQGADLFELHKAKRQNSALSPELLNLKGQLLSSIEYHHDGKLAIAVITPEMVKAAANDYEPYSMIIGEMQWVRGVKLAVVFKNYGTKINVPMRSSTPLAGPFAEAMGGGGHPMAGAYRCETTDIEAEKAKLIKAFEQFILEHDNDQSHETL